MRDPRVSLRKRDDWHIGTTSTSGDIRLYVEIVVRQVHCSLNGHGS